MKTVSIINYKGGVGKTTLTIDLAAELAYRGKNVLCIDMDAQASLTFSVIRPDEWQKDFEKGKTIKAWFDSFENNAPISLASLIFQPPRIRAKLGGRGRLDVLASHLGLINVDLDLATKLGGATLTQVKKNFITIYRRLLDGLSDIDEDKYEFILIDCPPNFNIVTKTAIVASDMILIPTGRIAFLRSESVTLCEASTL